ARAASRPRPERRPRVSLIFAGKTAAVEWTPCCETHPIILHSRERFSLCDAHKNRIGGALVHKTGQLPQPADGLSFGKIPTRKGRAAQVPNFAFCHQVAERFER